MTSVRIAWLILGLVWIVAEARLAKQSSPAQHTIIETEQHSQRMLWVSVVISLVIALTLKQLAWLPISIPYLTRQLLAMCLFAVGLGVRYWAVIELDRFFTTNVTIQQQHQLITTGPYRWIRHPAYLGLLMALFAAGIAMGDFLALCMLILPTFLAFKARVEVEEQMLQKAFPSQYSAYSRISWRLLPWLF